MGREAAGHRHQSFTGLEQTGKQACSRPPHPEITHLLMHGVQIHPPCIVPLPVPALRMSTCTADPAPESWRSGLDLLPIRHRRPRSHVRRMWRQRGLQLVAAPAGVPPAQAGFRPGQLSCQRSAMPEEAPVIDGLISSLQPRSHHGNFPRYVMVLNIMNTCIAGRHFP